MYPEKHCIRCGCRYSANRKLEVEDMTKSFPQYYCKKCLKLLPVNPVIVEVR